MKPWQVVFRKEFREVFRDGRTRFGLIVSPLLITPLILALVGTMASRQAAESRTETVAVAFVGLDNAPSLRKFVATASNLKVSETTQPDAEAQIRSRTLYAAAVVPPDAEQQMQAARPVHITVLRDTGSQSSQAAAARLSLLFDTYGKQLFVRRLAARGLSPEFATAFDVQERGIPGESSASMLLLATILPYVLSVSALMGGIYIANDSVAGEKERGTLETLLVSPASRRDLVTGKFFAVACVALVSSVLSLIGLVWPFYVPLPMFEWMSKAGLTLHFGAVCALLLVQIPIAVLGAGLLLTISTYARNQKEMQTYLGPLLIVVTVLAMTTMFLKVETPLIWALVPIANAAMVIKQALEGVTSLPFLLLASLTSLAYAALAVLVASRAFQKESILLKA
jgi:sodium transport system permease protein